jgi:dynein light chain Tctex-type 1
MNGESEDLAFVAEDVKALAKDSIESTLRNRDFKAGVINQWSSSIAEEITKRLCALNKPFKYVASCVIMQKTGAGLHLATSTFWDQTTDSSTTVRWENSTMYAILSIYGVMM